MPKNLMDELAEEAADVDMSSAPSDASVARLREVGERLIESQRKVSELEAALKDAKAAYNEVATREMPDLMNELGQDRMGFPNIGEFGADLVLEPYYHASIRTDWDDDQRQAAFDLLERKGDADLIKNVVTLKFSRGDSAVVKALVSWLTSEELVKLLRIDLGEEAKIRIPLPDVEMTVPWNTLTAYVRAEVEAGTLYEDWMSEGETPIDPVETLGATIGHVVKIKLRKKDK